jgi:hypothetical protein
MSEKHCSTMSSVTLLGVMSEKNWNTICRLQFYWRKYLRKNCSTICRQQLYCRKCLRKTAAQYVVSNFTAGNVWEKLQHNLSSATLLQEMSEKNCSTICRQQLYCRKCLRKTAAQSVFCNFTAGNVWETLQHNLSSATLLQEISEKNCNTISSATLLQEMSEKHWSTICRLQLYCRKCLRKTAAQYVACNFTKHSSSKTMKIRERERRVPADRLNLGPRSMYCHPRY